VAFSQCLNFNSTEKAAKLNKRVICDSFRSDFFQLKIKKETQVSKCGNNFDIRPQFQYFVYDMIRAVSAKKVALKPKNSLIAPSKL